MRKSYDFSNAVQGVHHKQYREGHSVRLITENEAQSAAATASVDEPQLAEETSTVAILEPDVAAAFPDSASVNQALRVLIKAAKEMQEFQKAS